MRGGRIGLAANELTWETGSQGSKFLGPLRSGEIGVIGDPPHPRVGDDQADVCLVAGPNDYLIHVDVAGVWSPRKW